MPGEGAKSNPTVSRYENTAKPASSFIGMDEWSSVRGPVLHAFSIHELGSSAMTTIKPPTSNKAVENRDHLGLVSVITA
jgi:hypothetical protein